MKLIRLLLMSLLLLGFNSCSNEDQLNEQDALEQPGKEILFKIGLAGATKASTGADFKSTFTEGDQIGLFIVKQGQTLNASGNYADNRKLTYSGGEWVLDGESLISPIDGSALSYYAYYPYTSGIDPTNMTFAVKNDQNAVGQYDLSDLIMAKTENQTKNTITLEFSHVLSLVQVEVVRGSNTPSFDNTLAVTLRNCMATGNIDLTANTATAKMGSVQEIVMHRVESGTAATYNYRALVPMQAIANGAELFSFVQTTSGKEINFTYSTETTTTLTGGNVTKWKITLAGTPPPAHNYAVGDVYPFTGTAVGLVFEISNGGKNGKVVSFLEKAGRWGTSPKDEQADAVALIRDADNGKDATKNLIVKRNTAANFASDYVVFDWLYKTVNANDLDGDWYMPSKNEMRSLYAAMSGYTYTDIKDSWVDSQPMPNFDTASASTARTNFNTKMTTAGGTTFNLSGQYWATTEISTDKVWSVHFLTGVLQNSKFKYDTYGRLRPILAF